MTGLTLTMPRLGETMDEGQIVGWMVAEGAAFSRGQPLVELETDKTLVEYPALGDGVLDEILAPPGARIAVGQPIARARVAALADWADRGDGSGAEGGIAPGIGAGAPAGTAAPGTAAPSAATPSADSASGPAAAGRAAGRASLRATPLARRIARQKGLALEGIAGTGPRGRIEREDVERGTGPAPVPTPAPARAAASAPGTAWLDLPGGRLAYAVQGNAGPVHLLLHGFAGDRHAWSQLAALLARAGQTVVTPDLPGHGQTTVEAPVPEAMTEAALRLAETCAGPLTLVGHSLGAAVAVGAALRLGPRVARVVLLAPAGCGPRIDAAFVTGMVRAQTAGEVAHLLRRLGARGGGALSDAALSGLAAEMARRRLVDLAQAIVTDDGGQRIDILRPLAQLAARTPVAALFGTDDRVVSATDALNLPPPVAAHFLPAGHVPHWDDPRAVADLILGRRAAPD